MRDPADCSPREPRVLLRKSIEVHHERIYRIFHVQVPYRGPDWVGFIQFGSLGLFATDSIGVRVAVCKLSAR